MAIGNDGRIHHNARFDKGSCQGRRRTGRGSQKAAIAAMPNGDGQILLART
ncbi:hypothetical protein [Kitasatospora sp. NPDC057223]|uniref:hypothetical protein n=1 Tax=Kitasatospora sp. NPDC057223 TaxID=3346055 RepID=UPI003637E83F